MTFPYQDLRQAIAALEEAGLLRHATAEVDKNWELSMVNRWIYHGYSEDNRYALMFDKVTGYETPVVVGVLGGSYETYAVCLGIDPELPRADVMKEIRERWISALDSPLEPKIVGTGACKDNVFRGDNIDIHRFPIPVWTPEKDRCWEEGYGFITAPYCVTKDPDTGLRNVGTYSVMVNKEPNEVVVSFANQSHLLIQVQRNESQGKATEIAIVVGSDPTVGMVSTTPMPHELDELTVAGGLRGTPVELVKCETVDLEVPATAEIVIEGKLLPWQQRPYESRGPFGEHTGYQGACLERPVMEITCITHRNNPIYQAFISQMPPSESSALRVHQYEALVLRQLRTLGIPVVDINMPETGQCNIVIVSIRKMNDAHPARVANAVFAVEQYCRGKFVIVVDDDIDVYDWDNVAWAVCFRTSLIQGRRRISFNEGIGAPSLDYSAAPSLEELHKQIWPSAGVFIDATRPYKPYPTVALPSVKYWNKVKEEWRKYGLPDLERVEPPKCIVVEEEHLREGLVKNPEFVPIKRARAD